MKFLLSSLIFINVSLYIVSLTLFTVASEFASFNTYLLLGAFALSIFLGVWKRNQMMRSWGSRFFQSSLTHLLQILIVLSILGITNFIILKKDHSFDLTKTNLNTLSDLSLKTVSQLNSKMEFKLFAKRDMWHKYEHLLSLYKNQSQLIELSFIDVDEKPALVRLYNIQEEGTLVVNYRDKETKLLLKDELSLTNLLVRLFREKEKKVYYLQDRGELALDLEDPTGGSHLRDMIISSGYKLESLDLRVPVPADVKYLMILDPKQVFLSLELVHLEEYLGRGGHLILTLSSEFEGENLKEYLAVLEKFGALFMNSLVLDSFASKEGGVPSIPIVTAYDEKHPITQGFTGRTLFPISGFFLPNNNTNYHFNSLASSRAFPGTWGEISFDEVKSGTASYNQETDFKGPLSLAVAIENKLNKGRITAFASGAFIQNQFSGQSQNFNLFMNSLNWTFGADALISLNRPEANGEPIYLSDIHLSFIFYCSVLFLPFLFFLFAIYRFKKNENL